METVLHTIGENFGILMGACTYLILVILYISNKIKGLRKEIKELKFFRGVADDELDKARMSSLFLSDQILKKNEELKEKARHINSLQTSLRRFKKLK